jgi:predicted kinase
MQVVVSNANPLGLEQPYAIRFLGYKYRVNQIAQIIQEPSGEYTANLLTREVPERIVDKMIEAWLEGSLPEITLKSNV